MTRNPEKYEFRRGDDSTGLRLFTLRDNLWGVDGTFVEFNPNFDVHAGVAYIGAKTSRSLDHTYDIFRDVVTASSDHDEFAGVRLAKIFTEYGHASVADMAPVMMFFDNLPMHLAYRLFNVTSVGGGQELSTRYVKLDDFGLPAMSTLLPETSEQDLKKYDKLWRGIQQTMADLYNHWYGLLRHELGMYLARNYIGEVKESTLDSRTLDVTRMFLPFGAQTRQAFLGSARNWVDIASQMRSSTDPQAQALGDQIVALLSLDQHPDASDVQAHLEGLTKYNEGSDDINKKIAQLRRIIAGTVPSDITAIRPGAKPGNVEELVFEGKDDDRYMTNGEALLASYIGTALPWLEGYYINRATDYVLQLTPPHDLSRVMFDGHTHHNLMRSPADVRGYPLWYESALAYHRDINRQRALGRNALLLSGSCAAKVIQAGFNDNFAMNEAVYWQGYHHEWTQDMHALYAMIHDLVGQVSDQFGQDAADSVAMNIMPLGNQVTMLLSGPPSQWNYMTSLRVALGGDFGYREDVWNMLENVSSSEPLLSGMGSHLQRPDVNSPDQIVGRS